MSSTSVYPTPINAFKQSKRSVLSVIVDNEPGILARIVGLFSGRGYNIELPTFDADQLQWWQKCLFVLLIRKVWI